MSREHYGYALLCLDLAYASKGARREAWALRAEAFLKIAWEEATSPGLVR